MPHTTSRGRWHLFTTESEIIVIRGDRFDEFILGFADFVFQFDAFGFEMTQSSNVTAFFAGPIRLNTSAPALAIPSSYNSNLSSPTNNSYAKPYPPGQHPSIPLPHNPRIERYTHQREGRQHVLTGRRGIRRNLPIGQKTVLRNIIGPL